MLVAAVAARSVALAGFGLDSVIEIVASAVVIWQLKGSAKARERKALRVIGVAFVLLALYIAAQSLYVLAVGFRPHHSQLGIVWLALTAAAMFMLAYGKAARMIGPDGSLLFKSEQSKEEDADELEEIAKKS